MWRELAKRLKGFPNAVLTGLDASGDPVSFRCRPILDHQAQVLRVEVPEGLALVPGPAGLLCHQHDDQLWRLRSFLVRGTLIRAGHGWVFEPKKLVAGMDPTPVGSVRMLRSGRRTTKRYLATRGLSRPRIPWEHYAQLRREALPARSRPHGAPADGAR
jgi:hypothetical protein